MNSPSLPHIIDIFYSGGFAFTGNKESAIEIAFLIDSDYLNLHSYDIAQMEDYRELFADHTSLELIDEASGGSFEHIALKMLGKQHLKTQGIESVYEHPFVDTTLMYFL